MSCILVAVAAMRPRSAPPSALFTIACVVRDVGCVSLYATALTIWGGNSPCTSSSGVLIWVIADTVAAVMRLARAASLWRIEMLHDRISRQNTEAPTRLSPAFQFWSLCCTIGLFAWVDWLCYANWIFGTWLIRPSEDCKQSNPLVRIVVNQLLADTIFYCVCTAVYATILISNRCCPSKLFPGFNVDTSNWPLGCPRLTLNTNMWRRRGETREQWRERLNTVSHDVHRVQPAGLPGMTTDAVRLEVMDGMSRAEIDTLRTFIVPEMGDLSSGPRRTSRVSAEPPDALVHTMNVGSSSTTSLSHPGEDSADKNMATSSASMVDLSTREQSRDTLPRDGPTSHTVCALCLCDYEPGDRVRELPCHHQFHDVCVDPWLINGRRTCPICARVVRVTIPPNGETHVQID
ncbi:hypothetical protein DFJ77DRAFT_515174 [Powellomyces hirtus]|nr:hypothetical protein DFJ77DRAFT_515174 [Powellomyces hirtus]